MVSAQGPAGSRRRLGAELRRLRTNSGLHLDAVAEQMKCSMSKISRLETGKGAPKVLDVQRLMRIYGVTSETETDMLTRLARDSRGHGWWEPYTEGVTPERFVLDDSSKYPSLEADAVAIRSFDLVALHGLLQTADYARAVVSALLPQHSREEIDLLVELRMKRQEALDRRQPVLRYAAVLDESVLRRVVGSREVMARQLAAVIEVARRPNVSVQVMPYEAGMHRAHFGRFAILEFPDDLASDVVFVEGPAGDTYLESESDVAVYKDVFDDVAEAALDRDSSLALLARYIDVHAPR
ncbi:MAG: helix-turn-helix domain-containing protein [Pseudonocardia sp.]|nr:helix-turn-helix domain-containing protein [Pseudonocardia sp.]